ncbi:MAG: hypothetical protein IJL30_06290 [Clostridia bacterium]|nr:hypothetical protein [Clostridia bacterium]
MNRYLSDILAGKEDNYMLPFYWQHGDHYEKIPEQVESIYRSGCRALCVESRPHRDFCGETWWRDMDLIISESAKRGMKVWILDDDHFPTGHAVGQVNKHPELRKWQLVERHVDVIGPLKDALLIADPVSDEHVFLGAYAYLRTGKGEECEAKPICLSAGHKNGFLQFSVPEGCLRVFFLYKTRKGGRDGYIDMLREESVKLLVDAVYETHFEHYGKYFGNTVAGFFSDEPFFGNGWYGPHDTDYGMYNHRLGQPGLALPWNDRIIGMMEEATGEDALSLLPALWFDFGEITHKIRHAYMDAATKLYRDCFTRQLGDWCEAHGVMYIGHIIEDMNAHARLGCSGGHYFRSLDGQHMSGIDIVLHQIMPGMSEYIHTSSTFGNNADPEFFDYVLAKLASSFANIGTQTEGRAMCEVFGAYGWAEGSPCMKWLLDYLLVRGVNHFVPHAFSPTFPDPDCPPHFGAEGKDPQYDGFSKIMAYGNKVAHLLSNGRHVSDVAVLYHADAEWGSFDGGAMLTQVPAKMLYDEHIDFDILPADCFIDGTGSRVFPARAENGRLCVGKQSYGCLVLPYAEYLPEKIEKAFEELENQGVRIIRMKKDQTKKELIERVDNAITRDVTVEGKYPLLRIAHYSFDDSDVYMFVNESIADCVSTDVYLRAAEKYEGGTVTDLLNDSIYSVRLNNGRMNISLAPYQSVIAVFEKDGERFKSVPAKAAVSLCDAELKFRIETAGYENLTEFRPYKDCADSKNLPNITDVNENPAFSGTVRYTCSFDRPNGVCGIDFGAVGQNIRLTVNGADLGIRVCPPYSFDISSVLKDGENEMVAYVSNTLANAIRDGLSNYMAIPASGIIGPVKWIKTE